MTHAAAVRPPERSLLAAMKRAGLALACEQLAEDFWLLLLF